MKELVNRAEPSGGLLVGRDHAPRTDDDVVHFFAQSLDLFCIAGSDGYLERVNPAWTTKLGWRLEELRARPFIEFVHPDDRGPTLTIMSELSHGAQGRLFENRYRHRDGTYRWLQWSARPVPGRARIYATAREITDLRPPQRDDPESADRAMLHWQRELHDGLCQTLAGISALSTSLARRLAAGAESAAAADIARLLDEAIGESRDLARGRGTILGETGLRGALETLSADTRRMFCVACFFECDAATPRLTEDVETHLFRIAQQAVNNALAHGHAERVDIRLQCKRDRGLLRVRDNGVGLPQNARDGDGIGLRTMAHRAHEIGGTFEARRRATRGTTVRCRFPLTGKVRDVEPCVQ